MLRPSAAPRRKMATRVLRCAPSADAARASHKGACPMPAMARDAPRRKNLRVNMTSSPFEFGGAEHQSGENSRADLAAFNARADGVQRLGGSVAAEQLAGKGGCV